MASDWPEASEAAMHAQDMLDQAADFGRMLMERDAEIARLAGQVAALRERVGVLGRAGRAVVTAWDDRTDDLPAAIDRLDAALTAEQPAAGGEGQG